MIGLCLRRKPIPTCANELKSFQSCLEVKSKVPVVKEIVLKKSCSLNSVWKTIISNANNIDYFCKYFIHQQIG